MKNKDYKKKRLELKDKKRSMSEMHFLDKNHMKAFKDDIKREYRANKRSEKQAIKKDIDEKLSDNQDT